MFLALVLKRRLGIRLSNFLHDVSIISPSTGLTKTILHLACHQETLLSVFGTGDLGTSSVPHPAALRLSL